MSTQVCKKCGVEKSVSEFAKGGKIQLKSGETKQYYKTTCKQCTNKGRVRFDNVDPKVCNKCGVSKPLSIFIKLSDGDESKVEKIKKIINENFDLSPRGIREMLKLNNPIYEVTSAYGHFGRKPTNKGEFTWEKTDKIDLFKL